MATGPASCATSANYLPTFETHCGYPRLRRIARAAGSPRKRLRPDLLVSYDDDASGKVAMVSNGTGNVARQFANRNHVMVEHSQPSALAPRHEYNGYATSGKITRTCGNDGHAWNHRYLDQKTVVHRQSVF